MANPKTAADEMFEEYLDAHGGYEVVYEPDYASELGVESPTSPDYLVRRHETLAVCEVKGFKKSKLAEAIPDDGYAALPADALYGQVRDQVDAAADSLRPLAGHSVPLVALLANPERLLVPLDDEHVIHALHGDPAYALRVNVDEGVTEDPGALIAARDGAVTDKHRFLSAVVTLHRRPHAADWRDQLSSQFPADDSTFEGARRAAMRFARAIQAEEEAGEAPAGEYLWAEVYDLARASRPDAVPLPGALFDGPRDTRYGWYPDGRYGPRVGNPLTGA